MLESDTSYKDEEKTETRIHRKERNKFYLNEVNNGPSFGKET